MCATNLPQNHIPRADLIAQLRDVVFTEGERGNIAVTALKGMGRIGKTVLATALCRDPVVRHADGIAWITFGRESVSDQLSRMREVARALGPAPYDTPLACENRYRTVLREGRPRGDRRRMGPSQLRTTACRSATLPLCVHHAGLRNCERRGGARIRGRSAYR